MRSALWRLRVDKRGLSGTVSGLLILVISVAIVAFIYETYNVQTQMSDYDAARVRERTEVTNVFFGGTNQYSPNSLTPANDPIANLEKLDDSYLQFNSSKGDQVITPISNMNFSTGDAGWIFEKTIGSRDVEGGYSGQEGAIYAQMIGLATGPYWMNWTYRFYYSQGPATTAYFNWRYMVWDNHLAASATAYAVLASPNGTQTVIKGPINLLLLDLVSWYNETVALGSGVISSLGTYTLTLAVYSSTSDTGNPHDSGNVVVFFDDVGITAVTGEVYSTGFYGTFNTSQNPSSLRKLQIYYAGRYVPFVGTLLYSPTSLTVLGSTSVVSGSYQNLAIKDGTSVQLRSYESSAPNGYNPSSYILVPLTTLQSGSITNLASDDGNYLSFSSYLNASDNYHFVNDETTNVDSSLNKGTHTDFTAQQNGPDSIFDTLAEQNTGELGGLTSATATGSIPNDMASNHQGCMGAVFFNPTNNVYTLTRVEFNASGATNQVFASGGVYNGTGVSYPTSGWALDGGQKVVYWSGTLIVQPHTSQEFYVDIKGNKKVETFNMNVRITGNSTVYSNSYVCEELNSNAPWSVIWLGEGPTPTFAVTASPNTEQTFYVSLEEDANEVAINAGGTLTISIPPEFTNVKSVGGTGWGTATITQNTVQVTNTQTIKNTYKTFAFNATAPSNPGLYMLNASFSGTPNTQQPVGNFSIQVTGSASTNYELDLEEQFTNVDLGQDYTQLCIYAGTQGSENLNVQCWTGSSWSTLLTSLTPNSWNNVSVAISDPYTIRFKGSNETSDTTQTSWQIDAVLLHTWTNEQVIEVELAGTSNTDVWSSLNWTINSAWSVSGVSATFQLYNNFTGQYPSSGDGYISYVSGSAGTDETRMQMISSNASNFRDQTGNWTIHIRGTKENSTQLSFLCDWVEFKPSSYYYVADWYGQFNIENFRSMEQVSISCWDYFNSSNVFQNIYIYNWNTSEYDQVGTGQTYPTASVGQWQNATISSNLDNYVSSSNVRVRIFSGAASSIDCYADFLGVTVYGGGVEGAVATQQLYVWDYLENKWDLLSSSNIGASDEMQGPIELNENITNYVDSQGTVIIQVCSECEARVSCQANFMMIRLYFVDPSKITLGVVNLGSETVTLARIWVDNSTGHSEIDLLTGVNVDRAVISPGEQAIIQIDYQYSTCQYTFKVVTKRGTIAAYVKTAS